MKEKLTLSQIVITVFGLTLFVVLLNAPVQVRENLAANVAQQKQNNTAVNLEKLVLPADGVVLPVRWGDFGKQMVETGVIDKDKFESVYAQRGGLNEYGKALLYSDGNGNIEINSQNAGVILNLLWGFGLANQNPILEDGPMMDSKYGGADRFAATGGWSIAKGDPMNHYSKHAFIVLTNEQQEMVERVSKNIFRPCCGNSTYFPDCNHGMAMLGLLELLASQNISEEDMYKTALQVNAYWFPSTYLTIAKYFENKGIAWVDVDPKEVLGKEYSSGSGYQKILNEIQPQQSGGVSCGV